MPDAVDQTSLTGSLEDYLETIYELVRDKKLARVRDIAKARSVKSGSVSPAMRRLADLGFIKYVEREYIDLTPKGEWAARHVYAKHRILTRFLTEVLRMPRETAKEDACAMEHNLSNEGMDHFVRFFEFIESCPEGVRLLERFRKCSLVHTDVPECELACSVAEDQNKAGDQRGTILWDLQPGETARVCQIKGTGSLRHRLLGMGIMPDTSIKLERVSADKKKAWVILEGFRVCLAREEAQAISVEH